MSALSIANPGALDSAVEDAARHHRAGRLKEAEALYRRVLAANPNHADALQLLGLVAHQTNHHDSAIELISKAIDANPANAAYHNNLGEVYRVVGRHDEGVASCRRAVALQPDFAEAHFNLANVLAERGDIDQAVATYARAVTLEPRYVEALYNASRIKEFTAGDPDINAIRSILERPETTDHHRMYMAFALARACENLEDFDESFKYYAMGNQIKRDGLDFDVRAEAEATGRLIESFGSSLFSRLGAGGRESRAPVFIVGMPRSGTSLIEQILASHPDVHGAGEIKDLGRLVFALPARLGSSLPYPRCAAESQAGDWARMADEYLAELGNLGPPSRRVTDKMMGNFQLIGAIHLMLPKAAIIHCARDPLDTCLSCFTTHFTEGQAFSYALGDLARYYREYQRLMAHWRAVLPGRMLEVRYEDVVGDLETAARRLIGHCGLEWNAACLEFHRNHRPVRTHSMAQVRRPLYATSIGRWRRYERHLGPLIEALGDLAAV